jgi:hypothetical protein
MDSTRGGCNIWPLIFVHGSYEFWVLKWKDPARIKLEVTDAHSSPA